MYVVHDGIRFHLHSGHIPLSICFYLWQSSCLLTNQLLLNKATLPTLDFLTSPACSTIILASKVLSFREIWYCYISDFKMKCVSPVVRDVVLHVLFTKMPIAQWQYSSLLLFAVKKDNIFVLARNVKEKNIVYIRENQTETKACLTKICVH